MPDPKTWLAIATVGVAFAASGFMRFLTPTLGATTSMLMGYGCLALFLFATWSEADARGLLPPSSRLVLAGLGWGLVLFVGGGAAYTLTSLVGLETGPPQSGSGATVLLAPGVLLAAASEELAFRGRLQSVLDAHLDSGVAVVLQAALFAAYHLSPGQLLATFVYGLILGLITRPRGLTLAVVAHLVLNVLGLIVFVYGPGSP